MSTSSNQEVVHEGWLTKSPPSKRIWRARWRRRWFALRQSGELPGQYFLEYYTDRNCRKLKGTIDLDQCEQVDAGLRYEQRKLKYQFMFDIKTPSRTYYLAAETEQDMNSWVECICQVCSLKVYTSDYPETFITSELSVQQHPPDVEITEIVEETDNNSFMSFTGPYIPISQCITGKPLKLNEQGAQTLPRCNNNNFQHRTADISELDFQQSTVAPLTPINRIIRKNSHTGSYNASLDCQRFYDSPRKHCVLDSKSPETYTNIHLTSSTILNNSNSPTLQSPTDSESVFTDEEWSMVRTSKNHGNSRTWHQSDSSTELDPSVLTATQRFTKLSLKETTNNKGHIENIAPPRPPKPLHLIGADGPTHNYLNLENSKPSIAERRAIKKQEKRILDTNIISKNTNDDTKSLNDNRAIISDDMYDFPRTHHHSPIDASAKDRQPKHCYNNAAPVIVSGNSNENQHIFRYDISPSATTSADSRSASQTFQYDFSLNEETDEPASPCSQSSCSTTAVYSNVPSPLLPPSQISLTPPAVNRGLKPGRGLSSDSTSVHSLNTTDVAPTVNRKLKPSLPMKNISLSLDQQDNGEYGNIRKPDLLFSRTNNSFNELADHQLTTQTTYNALDSPTNLDILQYLDLDLDVDTRATSASAASGGGSSGVGSLNSLQTASSKPNNSPVTVYKTVDFVRTEAFNRTKKSLEAERNKLPNDS